MSSHGVGLGASKKGRTSDSSMVTRNIKIVAQGQADATYASTQKKNPFRLSSAILNGDAYNGETLVRRNMQNSVPDITVRLTTSDRYIGVGGVIIYSLFSAAIPGAIYTFYNETGPDGVIPGVLGTRVVVAFGFEPGLGNELYPPGIVQVHDGTSGTTNYVTLIAPPNARFYQITRTTEPAPSGTIDLFSPFNVADWQLNNGYSIESTNPVGITIMTASPFAPNPGSPRSSSFYTKTQLDLTKSFVLSATFLTRTFTQAPPDGIAVAISADPATFGGNGGGVGIFNSSPPFSATLYPVLAVVMKSFSSKTTYLQVANTSGTAPTGPNNVSIADIVTDMTSINNLSITVVITYTSETGTLAWTITDSNNKTASNTYTNADLPTLLAVNNGYIGVGVGAGGKIQPVFLIGMSYIQ